MNKEIKINILYVDARKGLIMNASGYKMFLKKRKEDLKKNE